MTHTELQEEMIAALEEIGRLKAENWRLRAALKCAAGAKRGHDARRIAKEALALVGGPTGG